MDARTSQTAVVFYSRTGHSKRLAERLAQQVQGQLLEIAAPAYGGIFGYMRAGYNSLKQSAGAGRVALPSLAGFDRAIVCGPVWTSYPSVPLRNQLRAMQDHAGGVALFLTSGAHSPPDKAFETGAADLGRAFVATACVPNGAEGTDEENRMVGEFLRQFRASQPAHAQD